MFNQTEKQGVFLNHKIGTVFNEFRMIAGRPLHNLDSLSAEILHHGLGTN